MRINNLSLARICLKVEVRIQSGPAGPVRQIWVSGPVWSGTLYNVILCIARNFLEKKRKIFAKISQIGPWIGRID